MATTKKSSVKKPAATKTTAKKTVTAKPAAKKPVAAKKSAKNTGHKSPRVISLSIVPDNSPFLTFRITRQSIYWLIFSLAIMGLGLWVLNLNMQIIALYDQIDRNNTATSLLDTTKVPATHTTTRQ